MDDLMTGSNTIEECYQLQQNISMVLDSAGLPLRKWCSNSLDVLRYIDRGYNEPLFALTIGEDDVVKSLGLCWKPTADEFRYVVKSNQVKNQMTKRRLLSDLNRIFDPFGFLAPTLI